MLAAKIDHPLAIPLIFDITKAFDLLSHVYPTPSEHSLKMDAFHCLHNEIFTILETKMPFEAHFAHLLFMLPPQDSVFAPPFLAWNFAAFNSLLVHSITLKFADDHLQPCSFKNYDKLAKNVKCQCPKFREEKSSFFFLTQTPFSYPQIQCSIWACTALLFLPNVRPATGAVPKNQDSVTGCPSHLPCE